MMAPKQQPKKVAPPKAANPQKSTPTPVKETTKVTDTTQHIATQTPKKGGTGSGESPGLNTTKKNPPQPKAKSVLDLPVNIGNKVAQPNVNPLTLPTNIGNKVAQPHVDPLSLPVNVGNKVAQPVVNPLDLPVNIGNKVAQPNVNPLSFPDHISMQVAAQKKANTSPASAKEATPAQALPAQQMVAPSTGKSVAGIKATTAAAVKVAGAKDAVAATPVGAEQATAAEAVTATPASAKDNPAFAALTSNIAEKATAQKRHESAGSASRKGQAAAKAPAGEQLQTAQANQAEAMDQAEAKSFNTESFKAMLKDRISQMKMPKNEEEADDFDKHTNVGEINQQAVGDVTAVKGEAVGEVESTSNATPDTNSVPARKVAPMPKAKSGAKPAIGNVAKAMPPKRSAAEIEQPMAKEANKPDQALQEAGVSDHVLATSNEPSFTKALNAKETAKTQSQQATEDLRASEAAKQQQTQADAQAATNAQLAGMHGARVSGLNAVAGQQKSGAKANSAERKAVIDKVNSIFTSTQTAVNTALNGLDTEVTKLFDAGAKEAKQVFEDYTEKEMQAYKDKRYGDAWYDLRNIRRIGDAVTGLPKEVNNIYVLGRDEYIKALDSHITTIAEKVTAALTTAQNAIASGKQELKEYVDGLGPDLKALGQESASNIQSKFDSLEQDIADKQDSLIDSLADKYNSSVAEIDEDIAQRKEANKGLVGKAMSAIQGVIEFYNKIKALFDSLLTNVAAAGAAIMADPIGFAKNLFSGVGQGISNFMNNIGQHLQTGLIGWLTGASASLGITMPDNLFSAKGIFSLVTQVLGLSWNAVRGIGAQVIGERTMGILEKGFNLVMILKNEGITGLWEHLKESFINLKDQVIGQIKEMVITTVINAGMKWLLSLMNPAGALVKIVMGIVKVVQFIIERAASILELVDAFVQSIGAIAKGDVGAVAKNIEEALKRGIPLLIGMLANFLGLGSIARKVSKTLKKLRKPIVKGIKKLWRKLKKMGRKILRKFKKKKNEDNDPKKGKTDEKEVGETSDWRDVREPFKGEDEKTHTLFFKTKGGKTTLWVASTPKTIAEFVKELEPNIKDKRDQKAFDKSEELVKKIEKRKVDETNGDQDQELRKARDIESMMKALTKYVSVLFGVKSNEKLPESEILHPEKYEKGPDSMGKIMRANVLTKNGPKGYTPTAKKHKIMDDLLLRRNGGTSYYVRGHLLNEHIGGVGEWINMTPLSIKGNSNHLRVAEEPIKLAVQSGAIVDYVIYVKYGRKIPKVSDSQLEAAGFSSSEEKDKIKKIRAAEEYVPHGLSLRSYYLTKNGDKFERDKLLVNISSVLNPIDTSLSSYVLDHEKKEKVSLKYSTPEKIANNTDLEFREAKIVHQAANMLDSLNYYDDLVIQIEKITNPILAEKIIDIINSSLRKSGNNVILGKL